MDEFEKDLKGVFNEMKAEEQDGMPSFDTLLHRPISKKETGLIRPMLLKVGLAASLLLGILSFGDWSYFSTTSKVVKETAFKDWTISSWQADSRVLLETKSLQINQNLRMSAVSSISNWQAPSSSLMPKE